MMIKAENMLTLQGSTMQVVRQYDDTTDKIKVVELWQKVFGYETAHNDPNLTISKKLAINDRLFFVAVDNSQIVGTIMAGYDWHRGWLYSVAVDPNKRLRSLGSLLVHHAEAELKKLGCLKVKLQILASNQSTAAFYESLGYAVEPNISMGKLL